MRMSAEDDAQTAWTHFASNYAALQARAKAKGLQALVASYGPALIDRAVMDALCLHTGTSFATAMSANLCGIDIAGSGLADDLAGFDVPAFLAGQSPRASIAARHTVGLADAIDDSDALPDAPADGLPTTLAAAVLQGLLQVDCECDPRCGVERAGRRTFHHRRGSHLPGRALACSRIWRLAR
jgi:hypothetical protein